MSVSLKNMLEYAYVQTLQVQLKISAHMWR